MLTLGKAGIGSYFGIRPAVDQAICKVTNDTRLLAHFRE